MATIKKATSASKTPTRISIRYATKLGKWVMVDPQDAEKVTGDLIVPALLKDVVFETKIVGHDHVCGSRRDHTAGVATGTLSKFTTKTPKTGWQNLAYHGADGGFVNAQGKLEKADFLKLDEERHAFIH